jgi:hypothetical protein
LKALAGFLFENEAPIIETGLPRGEFIASPWLNRRLGKLYCLEAPAPSAAGPEERKAVGAFDIWETRKLTGRRRHDEQTRRLEIDPADAAQLVRGRPKLLELKQGVLRRLERALREGTGADLLDDCTPIMTKLLSGAEAEFYLRMDRFYQDEDARREGLWPMPSPLISATAPGGLSDLLEMLGHCEWELRFSVYDQTKRDLLELAKKTGAADWSQLVGESYLALVDKPWGRELDEVIDEYLTRMSAAASTDFWPEFRGRVRDLFANKWLWMDDWPATRSSIEEALKRLVRGQTPGSEAPLQPGATAGSESPWLVETTHAAANAFCREGDVWFIRYGGHETRLRDLKGLRYIDYLIANPDRDFDVMDLVHALDPPDYSLLGESRGTLGVEEAKAAGVGSDPFGSGPRGNADGPTSAQRRKYERLKEGLEDARERGDTEQIGQLTAELAALAAEVKAARGSDHGGPRDKAWRAVRKCVNDSRKRIQREHPVLWEHLKASLKIGYACSYRPVRPTVWNPPEA